ncbi:MAG TPA: sulfite exporter TauE/SafE family protein [Methanocella sp.]|nr:sulfite exporter TauE/SafE family protein [Methanocella sp.]
MNFPDINSLADIPFLYPFLVGFVMAINPCNMGVDLAGIAYVSLKLDNPRGALYSGTFYTIGRALTYMVFGLLIFAFGSVISDFVPALQTYENLILGASLVLIGIVMLDLLKFNFSLTEDHKTKYGLNLPENGLIGALAMGAVSSLALCPCTAIVFFGLLIPLSVKANIIGMSFPILFGIGTGIPILAFAILLGMSTKAAQAYLNNLVKYEPYARKIFGIGFILYGIYLLALFGMKFA